MDLANKPCREWFGARQHQGTSFYTGMASHYVTTRAQATKGLSEQQADDLSELSRTVL
jgi:hypothetical protein